MFTQSLIAASDLNTSYFDTMLSLANTPVVKDRFATMPMLTAKPAYSAPDEEELHTSFEQAISDRLLVINRQLSLKSGSLSYTQGQDVHAGLSGRFQAHDTLSDASPVTAPLEQHSAKFLPALAGKAWLRSITFGSLALMMMLVGFDLMGLLALYIR